jgi:hypothetical protein
LIPSGCGFTAAGGYESFATGFARALAGCGVLWLLGALAGLGIATRRSPRLGVVVAQPALVEEQAGIWRTSSPGSAVGWSATATGCSDRCTTRKTQYRRPTCAWRGFAEFPQRSAVKDPALPDRDPDLPGRLAAQQPSDGASALGAPNTEPDNLEAHALETSWPEPLPDWLPRADPALVVGVRQSLRLAMVTALQPLRGAAH